MIMQNTKNVVEQECRMFWRVAAELKRAASLGYELFEFLDELDVLRQMTDSELLKDRCAKLILQYAGRQNAHRPKIGAGV